jgi:6-pyruvoyltetrahydropterin/6-carboxytetrahydropterin synthase
MYELTLLDEFSAAHRLASAMGKCDRLHGHNWKVEVHVWAADLDAAGMVVDFHLLRGLLRQVLEEVDHSFLNEHPAFRTDPPTAENLARHIWKRLAELIPAPGARMGCVRVWESDTAAAAYQEGSTPFPARSTGRV